MSTTLRTFLLSAALIACGALQAAAHTLLDVPDSGGLFRFHLLEPGEESASGGGPSAFDLNEKELGSLRTGVEYWRLLLERGAANTSPLLIEISTVGDYDDNASAYSDTVESGPWKGYTQLAAALTKDWFGETGEARDDMLAYITVDHGQNSLGEWYAGPMASLPQNGTLSELSSTMLHELGHALGMAATAVPTATPTGNTASFDPDEFSLWSAGLRDSNGHSAQPGMTISSSPAEGAFVTAGKSAYCGVYFTGTHVQEVLNGALIAFASDPDHNSTLDQDDWQTVGAAPEPVPGLPINGWEPDEEGSSPEFSHIELQNSLIDRKSVV